MSQIVSAYLAYKLITLLAKPFKEWDAYKLGIIDEKGKSLRKPVALDEKQSFGMFERIVRKIKQVMNTAIGQSRTAAMLSTIYLIKEHDEDVARIVLNYCIKKDENLKETLKFSNRLKENLHEGWNNKSTTIVAGKYFLNEELINIKEDLKPVDVFASFNIYKYEDKIFTKEELKK